MLDGENCYDVLGKVNIAFGTFVDNTFAEDAICLSAIRVEEEYKALLAVLNADVASDGTTSFRSFLSDVVGVYLEFENKKMCDSECAGEIYHTFFKSCCVKRALDNFLAQKGNIVKLLKYSYEMSMEEDMEPGVEGLLDELFSLYDLEKFCGPDIPFYREVNRYCDALEA